MRPYEIRYCMRLLMYMTQVNTSINNEIMLKSYSLVIWQVVMVVLHPSNAGYAYFQFRGESINMHYITNLA